MGWETRKGGCYYYVKERVGSRVVSQYVRSLETALLLDSFRKEIREEREIERAAKAAYRAEVEALDAMSDEVFEMAQSLTNLALVALGFHQHKRSWRKMRDGDETKT